MTNYVLTTSTQGVLDYINQHFDRTDGQTCVSGADCNIDLSGAKTQASLRDFGTTIDVPVLPENATVTNADLITLDRLAEGKGPYVFIVPNACLDALAGSVSAMSHLMRTVPVEGTDQTRLIIEREFFDPEHRTKEAQTNLCGWAEWQHTENPTNNELRNLYAFLGGDPTQHTANAGAIENFISTGIDDFNIWVKGGLGHFVDIGIDENSELTYSIPGNLRGVTQIVDYLSPATLNYDAATAVMQAHPQRDSLGYWWSAGIKTITGAVRIPIGVVTSAIDTTIYLPFTSYDILEVNDHNYPGELGAKGLLEYTGRYMSGTVGLGFVAYDIWGNEMTLQHALVKHSLGVVGIDIDSEDQDAISKYVIPALSFGLAVLGPRMMMRGMRPSAKTATSSAEKPVIVAEEPASAGAAETPASPAPAPEAVPPAGSRLGTKTRVGIFSAEEAATTRDVGAVFQRGSQWYQVTAKVKMPDGKFEITITEIIGSALEATPPTPAPPAPPAEPPLAQAESPVPPVEPPAAPPASRSAPARASARVAGEPVDPAEARTLTDGEAAPAASRPVEIVQRQRPAAAEPLSAAVDRPDGFVLLEEEVPPAEVLPPPEPVPFSARIPSVATISPAAEARPAPSTGSTGSPQASSGQAPSASSGQAAPATPAPRPARAPAASKAPRPAPQPEGPSRLARAGLWFRRLFEGEVRQSDGRPVGWNRPSDGPHPPRTGLTPGTRVQIVYDSKWTPAEFRAEEPVSSGKPQRVRVGINIRDRGIQVQETSLRLMRVLLRQDGFNLRPGQIVEIVKTGPPSADGSPATPSYYYWEVVDVAEPIGVYLRPLLRDIRSTPIDAKIPYPREWE